jgi:hypothetical protein
MMRSEEEPLIRPPATFSPYEGEKGWIELVDAHRKLLTSCGEETRFILHRNFAGFDGAARDSRLNTFFDASRSEFPFDDWFVLRTVDLPLFACCREVRVVRRSGQQGFRKQGAADHELRTELTKRSTLGRVASVADGQPERRL